MEEAGAAGFTGAETADGAAGVEVDGAAGVAASGAGAATVQWATELRTRSPVEKCISLQSLVPSPPSTWP